MVPAWVKKPKKPIFIPVTLLPTQLFLKNKFLRALGGNQKYVWLASFWDKKLETGGQADKKMSSKSHIIAIKPKYKTK